MPVPNLVVIAMVSQHLDVSVDAICSATRVAPVAYARHVSMWLLRNCCGLSYPATAHAVGRADHTTAMSAVRRIDRLMDTDDRTSVVIGELHDRLRAAGCANGYTKGQVYA